MPSVLLAVLIFVSTSCSCMAQPEGMKGWWPAVTLVLWRDFCRNVSSATKATSSATVARALGAVPPPLSDNIITAVCAGLATRGCRRRNQPRPRAAVGVSAEISHGRARPWVSASESAGALPTPTLSADLAYPHTDAIGMFSLCAARILRWAVESASCAWARGTPHAQCATGSGWWTRCDVAGQILRASGLARRKRPWTLSPLR